MKIKNIKLIYETAINQYIRKFEKKHELRFESFVGESSVHKPKDIACFGDVFFFGISDIIFDINTKQPKGLIIDWLYDCIDHQDQNINFQSYSMGLRFKTLKDLKNKDEYKPEFVENVLQYREDYKNGKCTEIELKDLWKS